jgi:hypothetical protein
MHAKHLLFVTQITLVGRFVSMHEQATNLTMVLDDGTGRVEIKYFIDSEETELVRVTVAGCAACLQVTSW